MHVSCLARTGVHVPAKNHKEVWSFGYNLFGELARAQNVQTTRSSPVPMSVSTLSVANTTSVSLGCHHGAALTISGSVILWGSNSYGQLAIQKGIGVPLANSDPVTLSRENIGGKEAVHVAAGADFTLVVAKGGAVWSFGSNM